MLEFISLSHSLTTTDHVAFLDAPKRSTVKTRGKLQILPTGAKLH